MAAPVRISDGTDIAPSRSSKVPFGNGSGHTMAEFDKFRALYHFNVDGGTWDPSGNAYPTVTDDGSAVTRNTSFDLIGSSTTLKDCNGNLLFAGGTIRALVDAPGQIPANWKSTN